MRYTIRDTELGLDIAQFDTPAEVRQFIGTMGDSSLKVIPNS